MRLDAAPSSSAAQSARHEHPFDWAEADIAAILGRLQIEQETGVLGQHRSLEPVFSPDEVAQMTPAVHAAFQQAQPNEWVSFAFFTPSGTNLIVTSGGLYFKAGRLHVVLANYREKLHQHAVDIDLVRKNPLRSARGVNGRLKFDPVQLVTGTGSNWAGHANEPALEIVLDYKGLQDATVRPTPTAPALVAGEAVSPGITSAGRDAVDKRSLEVRSASSGKVAGQELQDLKATIQRLEARVDVLTRQLQEQDALLLKLRSDLDALRALKQRKTQTLPPSR